MHYATFISMMANRQHCFYCIVFGKTRSSEILGLFLVYMFYLSFDYFYYYC